MARFTDSPYEYMMAQKPSARLEKEKEPVSGRPDKCQGCPYGRARPCVGFCMRILISGGQKRRSHETDT